MTKYIGYLYNNCNMMDKMSLSRALKSFSMQTSMFNVETWNLSIIQLQQRKS